MNRLLLFDIDGTLIDTQGAGLASLEEGIRTAFPGREHREFPMLDLGGATDGGVVTQLFGHFEIEFTDDNRDLFFRTYSLSLERRLKEFQAAGRGRALPGTSELLAALREGGAHALGLLTGNIEVGARIKLRHFSLDHYFAFGAFGDDHHDRNRLGPIAIDRACAAISRAYTAAETVIVGDTLKDIACARACGARVVAVATGMARAEDLQAAVPDVFLEDFSDTASVLAAIESAFSR